MAPIISTCLEGVEAVVGEGDGLRVLQLREDFRLEDAQAVDVVALGGGDGGLVGGGAAGEEADAGVLAVLGDAVLLLELLVFAAQLAGDAHGEVVGEREEEFGAERLK